MRSRAEPFTPHDRLGAVCARAYDIGLAHGLLDLNVGADLAEIPSTELHRQRLGLREITADHADRSEAPHA